jgi:Flp pilus assembly protein TadB
MANPGQLRDEFRRVTNRSKYGDTVREFFARLDAEIRALAAKE